MKGIAGRWIKGTLTITFVIITLAVVIVTIAVRASYYNSVKSTLIGKTEAIRTYSESVASSYGDFYSVARETVKEYTDYNIAELMILNVDGKPIVSSAGFINDDFDTIIDYTIALKSKNGIGTWTGVFEKTGEKVMAATALIYNDFGVVVGGVRMITSLSKINFAIAAIATVMVFVGIIIMLLSIFSGTYFINTILVPVNSITATARTIAEGDYSVRIKRKYDDEIGELSDAINDLANGLSQTDKMKNDFIATVSHELRTPLTAIRGWGETVLSAGDDRDVAERGLSVIMEETDRLSKMVEDLLDFSRLQSGRLTMKFGPCDLLAELQEAIIAYEPRAKAEGKIIDFIFPEQEIPVITADGDRIRQVFINIIDNAVKYTDSGGFITVRVASAEEYITVTVKDNGIGISRSELDRVGEKFYKANFTRRGSGIGLATCDEILRRHNGFLGIDSVENKGTVVSVALPRYFNPHTES